MVHASPSGASFHCYIPFSSCVAVGRECLSLFRCTFSQMDVNPRYTCFLRVPTAHEHIFYRRYSLFSLVSSASEDPQRFEVVYGVNVSLFVEKTVRNATPRMVNGTPGNTIKETCLLSLLLPISSLEKAVHCKSFILFLILSLLCSILARSSSSFSPDSLYPLERTQLSFATISSASHWRRLSTSHQPDRS